MLLREDFKKLIDESVARYPAVAALVKAGDPRILQHLEAMAAMFALYSSQLEVAQAEPFSKVRDSTVLADAAMRGIVPKSVPARVRIRVDNSGSRAVRIEAGRALMDAAGRLLRIEAPVEIPGQGSAYLEALQLYARETRHEVSGSSPFYAIEIARADDDASLCGVSVADADGEYEYRERYTNTTAGERVYHVEMDERQRAYVRLGWDGVVGVQPVDGQLLTVTTYYSAGSVEFRAGGQLALETTLSPDEALLTLVLDEVLFSGQAPISMQTLRELAKYPSIYNHNAVFLGEFDFLVRRNFPSLQFLSVWNEDVEERHRGASLDSINTLFVACLSADGGEDVLWQAHGQSVAPRMLAEDELTVEQRAIRDKIRTADDSYKVRFYTPVRAEIPLTVEAIIASTYSEATVREQIGDALLEAFGERAAQSQRGQALPLYQQIYRLLRERVPALQIGRADLRVLIDEGMQASSRPELWRYVSPASLTVRVSAGNVITPHWGAGF